MKIEAKGPEIKIFAGDEADPVLTVRDAEFKEGLIGVRYLNTLVLADNIKVESLR